MTDAADPRLSPPVDLDSPVRRGDTAIESVRVRKPSAGELRGGVSLVDLGQLDVDALIKVLPRITVPPLTAHEVAALEASDILALGAELSGFLLPKAARPASPAT